MHRATEIHPFKKELESKRFSDPQVSGEPPVQLGLSMNITRDRLSTPHCRTKV